MWARRRRHRQGSSLLEACRSRRTRVGEWWLRSRGWKARRVCRRWACACAGGGIRARPTGYNQCPYHMIRTMAARGSEAGSSAKTERLGMRARPAVRPASGRTCWEVVSRGRAGVVCFTHLPEQRCEGHWSVNVCEYAAAAIARARAGVVVATFRMFNDLTSRGLRLGLRRRALASTGVNTRPLSHA